MTECENAVRCDGEYGYSDDELTAAVTNALADAAGVDPMELPPLYDSIDADALTSLCGSADGSQVIVRFAHAGHVVEVDNRGTVEILAAD